MTGFISPSGLLKLPLLYWNLLYGKTSKRGLRNSRSIIKKEMEENRTSLEFTPVSIDSFFDKSEVPAGSIGIGITILTKHQEMLVKKLLDVLHKDAPDRVDHLETRLRNVEKLAKDIALFPSLL